MNKASTCPTTKMKKELKCHFETQFRKVMHELRINNYLVRRREGHI